MTERGILFTAPMVRALLDGRKTQTRRVVKNPDYYSCLTGDCPHQLQTECAADMAARSPYGGPGDLLWVREAWAAGVSTGNSWHSEDGKIGTLRDFALRFRADDEPGFFGRWRPGIHMPRWASRITLRITDVRVERLNEISEGDARSEGLIWDEVLEAWTAVDAPGWQEPSGTVTGSSHGWDNGRFSVADPRPAGLIGKDQNSYGNQAHYGVVPWEAPSGSVTASGQFDNGRWSVADKRTDILPGLKEQLVCQIISLDGTWHRPFTTLELAALQSLYDPEDVLELDGKSDSAWRERIGNAVPSSAAKAIADVMGETLLRAEAGESFTLSNQSIWVRQMQIALSVDTAGQVPAL